MADTEDRELWTAEGTAPGREPEREARARPTFSIVMPTHGRPGPLARCIEAIAGLEYPGELIEVTIVDDGGPGSLDSLVQQYRDRLDITLIRQPQAGPARARNRGAEASSGDYLAFTDDDCAPAPDWLAAMAKRLRTGPDLMLGGRTLNALPHNLCAEASQQLVSYLYEYYNAETGPVRFLTSNNLVVPRAGFLAIDGFSARFPRAAAEDRDLCERWLETGRAMDYVPDAVVHHAHHLDLRGFIRQHYNYGRGARAFHQARAARGSAPIRVEPARFYLRLLAFPFSHAPASVATRLSALMLLSQAANATGYFAEAVHARSGGAATDSPMERAGR